MATEMGVCEKTIRRDLALFQNVGFPLEESTGMFGRKDWRIRGTSNQPQLSFNFEEAIALYMGRGFLQPLVGTLFWEAAQQAFQKIRMTMGKPALDYIDRFATLFHHTAVGASDYSGRAGLIDDIVLAIEDRKRVRIHYQSEQALKPTTREIHPYGMAYHHGSLYLIAFAPDHNQVRHYKVDRIESVDVTSSTFMRPETFDLRAHLAGAFGIYSGSRSISVRVKFLPQVARCVLESRWHHSQCLIKEKDGCVVAEFELSDTTELKSWVMSFGAKAIVLEPEGLRQEILDELRLTISLYELRTTRRKAKPPIVAGPSISSLTQSH
jgi:predicted DNA-binding transcriptional regulator YafY